MQSQGKTIDFKVDNVKVNVIELETTAKHIRKIHTKQKVNNILIECESFERYVKSGDENKLMELTLWADIKVFGNHKYKPAYNYELHANLNSRYNQIYDSTYNIKSIKPGSTEYETFQRVLRRLMSDFDDGYATKFINLIVQMNNGKVLSNVPNFILNMADNAVIKANNEVVDENVGSKL